MSAPLSFRAMQFARAAHAQQVRKYTGEPYICHLGEVAGLVATCDSSPETAAAAWLHDTVEDTAVTYEQLTQTFGRSIADAVQWLTDCEQGNRAARQAAKVIRLARAPSRVQSIKVADIISNAGSIKVHDPKFYTLYRWEVLEILDAMREASPSLRQVAYDLLLPPRRTDGDPL